MDTSVACYLSFCKIQQRNVAVQVGPDKNLGWYFEVQTTLTIRQNIGMKQGLKKQKIPYQNQQKYLTFQTQEQINFHYLHHKSAGDKIGTANECHPRASNWYTVFLDQQQQKQYLSLKLTFLQTVFDQLEHKESGNRRGK